MIKTIYRKYIYIGITLLILSLFALVFFAIGDTRGKEKTTITTMEKITLDDFRKFPQILVAANGNFSVNADSRCDTYAEDVVYELRTKCDLKQVDFSEKKFPVIIKDGLKIDMNIKEGYVWPYIYTWDVHCRDIVAATLVFSDVKTQKVLIKIDYQKPYFRENIYWVRDVMAALFKQLNANSVGPLAPGGKSTL